MTYGMNPPMGMPNQGYYMQNMSQMINQQLTAGAGSQLAAAQQEIASAMQMLQQRYSVDAMQMPYIPPSFVSGPPPWQMAYIPSPESFQKTQAANPPGLTPAGQGWPKGTTVTQGGMIVMPSSGGTVKIFNPGASGPSDSAKLQFSMENDKVYDRGGKEAFDLRGAGGVLKLSDGSVISSALDKSGLAHVNVISNNSRETIDYGVSGYDTTNSQDGSSYLQNQLGTSALQANTYGVSTSSTGDVNFYKLKGGNILGKVTGTAWQPDPQKLSNLVTGMIGILNSSLGSKFKTPPGQLNPQDYTDLIKGNDISEVLKQLQSDITTRTGRVYDLSGMIKSDSKITNPKQLKDLVDQMATDMTQNTGKSDKVPDAMIAQMKNLVANTDVAQTMGDQQATVDPNDKNFLVTPPQFSPSQSSSSYPNILSQNLQQMIASGQLPPEIAAYLSGAGGGQNQGPWANQFAGGLYNPQQSLSQQLAPLPTMWGSYNDYASMKQGLPRFGGYS